MHVATRVYRILLLAIACHTLPSQTTDWSWLFNRDTMRGFHCLFDSTGQYIITTGTVNVYRGSLFNRSEPLLPLELYSLISDRPVLKGLPGGTVLLLGSSFAQDTSSMFRFDNPMSQPVQTDMDGDSFNIGIAPGEVKILGNEVIKVRNIYSFNRGKTWYSMRNSNLLPMYLQPSCYSEGDPILVYDHKNSLWYSVDTLHRRYDTTFQLDPSMCKYALLEGGAGLAIRCVQGDEMDLMMRRSPSDPWESVPPLTTEEGVVLDPKRFIYLKSQWLLLTRSNKAVLFLDSGRVIEFDGQTTRVRTLGVSPIQGNFNGDLQRVRDPDIIRIVYLVNTSSPPFKIYTIIDYSLATEEVNIREGLARVPQDISSGGYLSHGPYYTDWVSSVTRPAIAAFDRDGRPVDQLYLCQIIICGSIPVVVAETGDIFAVDDPPRYRCFIPFRGQKVVAVTRAREFADASLYGAVHTAN